MSLFPKLPPAPSPLARHRLLSPKCGLRVSPLCLGAMSIGTAWKDHPLISATLDKKGSFELLDHFHKLGGNFIDTANTYQKNQSEEWIGEWMEQRKNRDEMVIATKYTTLWKGADETTWPSNFCGNHAKSLRHSLDASLKKLRTDFVDVLYVHWYDYTTGVEPMMQALNREVQAGRVLYLGASDMPAWVVCKANMYARQHGFAEFVVYQGLWNVALRDFEREIIPMCRDMGLGFAPWGALGQGRFRLPEQVAEREREHGSKIRGGGQSDSEKRVALALDRMGREEFGGASIAQMALAYVLNKTPYVFPIVGGTKTRYLDDNVKAIDIKLSEEQIRRLEAVVDFSPGFPTTMIGEDPHVLGALHPSRELLTSSAHLDFAVAERPAHPAHFGELLKLHDAVEEKTKAEKK